MVRTNSSGRSSRVIYSSSYRQAKQLRKDLPKRISDYERNLAAYKERLKQYGLTKQQYEQRVKAWKAKYKPFIRKKGQTTIFAPTRQLPQRTVKKAYKEYRKSGKEIQSFYDVLRAEEKALSKEQTALRTQSSSLKKDVKKYEQLSKTATRTIVRDGQAKEVGWEYFPTKEGLWVQDPVAQQTREATPLETIQYYGTGTTAKQTWGEAAGFYFTEPEYVQVEKPLTPFGKIVKWEQEKIVPFTSKFMPEERAERIARRVQPKEPETATFTDWLAYSIGGEKGMEAKREYQYGATKEFIKSPFYHPIKFGVVTGLSAASFGFGGTAAGAAFTGSTFGQFLTIGGAATYGTLSFASIVQQPTALAKGERTGYILGTEIAPMSVGYGLYAGGKALASYGKTTVSLGRVSATETKPPTRTSPGRFEVTGRATAKTKYPFRVVNRVVTKDYGITGSGDIIGSGGRTYSLQKLEFIDLPITKSPTITKADMFGYTEKIPGKDKLYFGESVSGIYGDQPKLLYGQDIIKEQFVLSGFGKETTGYTSLGGSKQLFPATSDKPVFNLGEITYTRTIPTSSGSFIKTFSGKPVLSTKSLSKMVGTVAKVTPTTTTTTSLFKPFTLKTEQAPKIKTKTVQTTSIIPKESQTYLQGITSMQTTGERQRHRTRQKLKTQQKLKAGVRFKEALRVAPKQRLGTSYRTGLRFRQRYRQAVRQKQATKQTYKLRYGFAGTPIPPTPVGFVPLGLFGGFPKGKRRKKARYFYQTGQRKPSYKPSLVGITLKPAKFKPSKMFTGLEVRRVRL